MFSVCARVSVHVSTLSPIVLHMMSILLVSGVEVHICPPPTPSPSPQAVEVIQEELGVHDPGLHTQQTEAFLSLARFSDAQYQSIDNYMKSSEFENKQALLKKAKEEVDLMEERKVNSNRSGCLFFIIWKSLFFVL